MPNIKRCIILARNGENHVFYKFAPTDNKAVILAIHTLEKEQGLMRGALVPYFKCKWDKNLWDINKVEVTLC